MGSSLCWIGENIDKSEKYIYYYYWIGTASAVCQKRNRTNSFAVNLV